MNAPRDPDVILATWLDDGPADLPSSTRRAISTAVRTTPQSRTGLGLPAWRPTMSKFLALAGAAAVVAVVVGALAIGLPRPSNGIGATTPTVSPSATPSPTPSPTTAPSATPAPSEIAPGITGFTPFTSPVYGLTIGIPDGWTQGERATLKWQEGGDPDATSWECFESNQESVAFCVWQQPAGPGADITTRDGLAAWVRANDPERDPDGAIPLCVGKTACGPAILLPASGDTIPAYIADPDAGLVTIVLLGRPDDFPDTARYGGGVQLLKSILTTMDVYEPEPGQIPAGS